MEGGNIVGVNRNVGGLARRGIDGFVWKHFEFPIFGQRRREVDERVHGTECDAVREQKQTTLDENEQDRTNIFKSKASMTLYSRGAELSRNLQR